MGVFPGDGQSERFLAIGQRALADTEAHLHRTGMHPLPGKRHEAVLDNAIQGLVRAAAFDGATAEDVISALAHSVGLQWLANGMAPALMVDFGQRVGEFAREAADDSRSRARG